MQRKDDFCIYARLADDPNMIYYIILFLLYYYNLKLLLYYVFAIIFRFVCFVCFISLQSFKSPLPFPTYFPFLSYLSAFPPYLRNSETISFLIGDLLYSYA